MSLRISADSAATLTADPGERRPRLRTWLDAHDMYVYTVNAFPYGPFKGRVVMEKVYEPDWATEGRVAYSVPGSPTSSAEVSLAPHRRSVDPDGTAGVPTEGDLGATDVAVLHRGTCCGSSRTWWALERRTGRRVKLALEPEPFWFLETTEETVRYFQEHVWSAGRHRSCCPG